MNSISKLILLAAVSSLALASCEKAQTTAGANESSANETPASVATPINSNVKSNGKAKNVILFIGDGMGISTITAARIFDGQSKGMSGEDNMLSFEEFPHLSLVKTYNLDAQVADSAGTASAMNTGLKTQISKINVRPDGLFAGCADSAAVQTTLFADMAERAGMSTGIVTTTRLTHATPAAFYGHSPSRYWEHDGDITPDGVQRGCIDLATQMINYSGTGMDGGLEIALGGGRRNFLSKDEGGRRKDGVNLTVNWSKKSNAHTYVGDASALRALDPADKNNVLGLFDKSHLDYEADRENAEQPSLTEMTEFAIKNLEARGTGYYLMVEAGRIDHAHHGSNAYRALSETQELARAVALADKLTNDEDTLILVTADHSHVLTIAGYPALGNPILGLVRSIDRKTGKPSSETSKDADGLPYTTLGYHNGQNPRSDVPQTDNMVQAKDYKQQSAIRRASETHAGEDVALYAKGPGADKVHGVIDQAEIFDIMGKAVGIVD